MAIVIDPLVASSKPASQPRLHYSLEVKLRTIEFAEIYGNRAAERATGANEGVIRRWRRIKEKLLLLPPDKSTLRTRTCAYPDLEAQLMKWMQGQQQMGVRVSCAMIRSKALDFAQQAALPFKPGQSWVYRFLNRSGLRLFTKPRNYRRPASTGRQAKTKTIDLFVSEVPVGGILRSLQSMMDETSTTSVTGVSCENVTDVTSNNVTGESCTSVTSKISQTISTSPSPQSNNASPIDVLSNRFRRCEKKFLGINRPAVQSPTLACSLCGEQFERPGGQPSIPVCGDCQAAMRAVRQQMQPMQASLSTLETLVTSLKSQLDKLVTPATDTAVSPVAAPVVEDDEEKDISDPRSRLAELLRENTRLKNRLLRFEKAEMAKKAEMESRGRSLRALLTGEVDVPSTVAAPATKAPVKLVIKKPISNQKRMRKGWLKERLKQATRTAEKDVPTPGSVSPHSPGHGTIFDCFVCGLSLPTQHSLQRHLTNEHEDTSSRFLCTFCPQQFTSQSTLQRHLKQHPSTSNEEMAVTPDLQAGTLDNLFPCLSCSEVFALASSLHDHLVQFHPDLSDGGRRMRCRICGKRITNSGNLRRHESRCVATDQHQVTPTQLEREVSHEHLNASNLSTEDVATSPALFECQFCSETFVQPDFLIHHMDQYHAEESWNESREMIEEENEESGAKGRKRTHLGVECRTCGKTLNQTWNLRRHERRCARANAGNKVAQRSQSERRQPRETMSRSKNCKHCGKMIIHPWNMMRHERKCAKRQAALQPHCQLNDPAEEGDVDRRCRELATLIEEGTAVGEEEETGMEEHQFLVPESHEITIKMEPPFG